jgi:prevent-host-death family protein
MAKKAKSSPQNRIGIREIRQDASMILARVEGGEEFVVTNRGVPVAKLLPYQKSASELIEEMIAAGDITEAEGNIWDLPAPTVKLKGKSASQLLIEERERERNREKNPNFSRNV